MTWDDYQFNLQDHLSEIKREISLSSLYILIYYEECDVDFSQLNVSPPTQPPHQSLIKRGSDLLEASAKIRDPNQLRGGLTTRDLEIQHILIGAGAEVLLTGVYLKVKTGEFIDYIIRFPDRSPKYNAAKRALLDDLGEILTEDELEQINTTLLILREQRNHFVHQGYGGFHHKEYYPILYRVLGALTTHYTEEDIRSANYVTKHGHELGKARGDSEVIPLDFLNKL